MFWWAQIRPIPSLNSYIFYPVSPLQKWLDTADSIGKLPSKTYRKNEIEIHDTSCKMHWDTVRKNSVREANVL